MTQSGQFFTSKLDGSLGGFRDGQTFQTVSFSAIPVNVAEVADLHLLRQGFIVFVLPERHWRNVCVLSEEVSLPHRFKVHFNIGDGVTKWAGRRLDS